MQRLRDLLIPSSRALYMLWRASRTQRPIDVTMTSGEQLSARPPPAADLSLAVEIFIAGAYEPPPELPPIEPALVVDVGANVGYTVVLWSKRFPGARLLAFEPHPEHLHQLYRHVLRNDLSDRVEIVGAAVSHAKGRAFITNDEAESQVVSERRSRSTPILVRDFFEEVGNERIGLLKMDIEGGEFDILSDARFEHLAIDAMVLEWHNTSRTPDGRSWCRNRLQELGYRTADGKLNYGRAGVIWAWRP